jgi:AraC family transcriptional regulator
MQTRKIMGTRDWASYSIVLDVPRDAAEIHFGILLDGRGRVWADDFTFEVVGRDVETTSRPTQRTPRRRPPTPDLLDRPTNLGFDEESAAR